MHSGLATSLEYQLEYTTPFETIASMSKAFLEKHHHKKLFLRVSNSYPKSKR